MSTYYFKCIDTGTNFYEFQTDEENKQSIAEEAVEIAYHDLGMREHWYDGDNVEVTIYNVDKVQLFVADVNITVPEPEFMASIG